MTYTQRLTELTAKNLELSNYLLILLQRSGGEAYFSEADINRMGNKLIEKTVLTNGIVRLAVVDRKEPV